MNDQTQAKTGQVTRSAAEVYEEFFVPALFGEWAAPVVEEAAIGPGQTVLDVACGTGVVAREAARRVGPRGHVTGIDLNPGMLATARRLAPAIEWREGRAEALPFADATFDAVTCQFALMFFQDRPTALAEMWRVLRPGGKMAVAVWGALSATPGYAAMVALLDRLFGDPAAEALRAPFVLGDPAEIMALFRAAGIPNADVVTRTGTARFPSIEGWVHTDVKGWTLADMIDDAQYALLQRAAARELKNFAAADGTVTFPAPAHIAVARKE